jgi:hypothetical protein
VGRVGEGGTEGGGGERGRGVGDTGVLRKVNTWGHTVAPGPGQGGFSI